MTDIREGKIVAPWSAETVLALNAYQVAGVMHPFTCGRDSQHGAGYLLATEQGWVCIEDGCGYTQDWAHDFMTTEAARTPFWQRAEVLAKADDMRASNLAEMIERCDSIMGALKDLGVDGDDADFHDAFAYTENARQQVGWLRQEFDTARAAIASVPPSSASVAPQPKEAG